MFAIRFTDGEAQLQLNHAESNGPVTLKELTLRVPMLELPRDLDRDAAHFRSRLLSLHSAKVVITMASLAAELSRSPALADLGMGGLVLRGIDSQTLAFVVDIDADGKRGALSGRLHVVAKMAGHWPVLEYRVTTLRPFGRLPQPLPLYGHALCRASAAHESVLIGAISFLRPLLVDRLPRHGFRLPELDTSSFSIAMDADVLTVSASPEPNVSAGTEPPPEWLEAIAATIDRGAVNEALRHLETIINRLPKAQRPAVEQYRHSLAFAATDRTDETLRAIVALKNPVDPIAASLMLGALLADKQRYKDAAAAYEKAAAAALESATLEEYALCCRKVGETLMPLDHAAAAGWLEKAYQSGDESMPLLTALATVYRDLGQTEDVYRIERRRVGMLAAPEQATALLQLGRMLSASGDHAGAEEPLLAAQLLDARDPRISEALAEVASALGDRTGAERHLRGALAHTTSPRERDRLRLAIATLEEALGQRSHVQGTLDEIETAEVAVPASRLLAAASGPHAAFGLLRRASKVASAGPELAAVLGAMAELALLALHSATDALSLAEEALAESETIETLHLAVAAAEAVGNAEKATALLERLAARGDPSAVCRIARELLQNKRATEAALRLQKLVEPDGETLLLLARALLAVGDSAAERATLESLATRHAEALDTEAVLRLAALRSQSHDAKGARRLLESFLNVSDAQANRRALLEQLRDVLLQLGDDEAVEVVLRELVPLFGDNEPERGRVLVQLGQAHLRLLHTKAAHESFLSAQKVLADTPEVLAGLVESGAILRQPADFHGALEKMVDTSDSPAPQHLIRLAELERLQGRVESAEKHLTRALGVAREPTTRRDVYDGLLVLFADDDRRSAQVHIEAATDEMLEETPRAKADRFVIAAGLQKAKKQAQTLYERALTVAPNHVEALKGLRNLMRGKHATYLNLLRRLVGATQQQPHEQLAALAEWAAYAAEKGKPGEARELYERTLLIDPLHRPAIDYLVALAESEGATDVAAELRGRLEDEVAAVVADRVAAAPRSDADEAQLSRAQASWDAGDLAEAGRLFSALPPPRDAWANFLLDSGDHSTLIALMLEEPTENFSDESAELYRRSAQVAKVLGQPVAAAQTLERATHRFPKNVDLFCDLGDVLLKALNDEERAARAYSEAFALDPSRTELVLAIADRHANVLDHAAARQAYREALRLFAVPAHELERVYLWLARDAHANQDYLVEETLLDLLDEKTHSLAALHLRAQLYRDRGDVERLPGTLVAIAARVPEGERRELLIEAARHCAPHDALSLLEQLLLIEPNDVALRVDVLGRYREETDQAIRLEAFARHLPLLDATGRASFASDLVELARALDREGQTTNAELALGLGLKHAPTLSAAELLFSVGRRANKLGVLGPRFASLAGDTRLRPIERGAILELASRAFLSPDSDAGLALDFFTVNPGHLSAEQPAIDENTRRALLARAGRHDELLAAIERDLKAAPPVEAAIALEIQAAELRGKMGRVQEAAKQLGALFAMYPDQADLATATRAMYTRAGQSIYALSVLEDERRLRKNDPVAQAELDFVRAELLIGAGAHREALSLLGTLRERGAPPERLAALLAMLPSGAK